jgi:hypothetical protein
MTDQKKILVNQSSPQYFNSITDRPQAWYAEFLLEIDLKVLLRKTGARLIFKIALISLHIDPGLRTSYSFRTFIEPKNEKRNNFYTQKVFLPPSIFIT